MILYRRATTNGSPVPYGPRIDAYDYSVLELEKRFDFEEEWQKAGKPLKSKAFYSALKDYLST